MLHCAIAERIDTWLMSVFSRSLTSLIPLHSLPVCGIRSHFVPNQLPRIDIVKYLCYKNIFFSLYTRTQGFPTFFLLQPYNLCSDLAPPTIYIQGLVFKHLEGNYIFVICKKIKIQDKKDDTQTLEYTLHRVT